MASDQAASSSITSNSKSTRRTCKYDVFLSFRGEDTRLGFTEYLYHLLDRSGLRVFKDDEEIRRGEVISQELLQAIEESRSAIVILSKYYASSSWCLDELQHILISRNKVGQIVFPIFYYVDPSDVRNQRNSFGEAFAKLEHMFQHEQRKVRKWRDSLTEVARLSGFDSSQYRYEVELIDKVVEHLWDQVRSELPPLRQSDALIGIDWRVDEMVSVLGIGFDDVRFIGIWGMGGVGKTTLARAIYERFHSQFDFHFFLSNVRELSESNGVLHLQRKLLSHLTKRNIDIDDTREGKIAIRHIFRSRKVMLILDAINNISQLENLVGSHEWFGDGSRIIITTRDAQLLTSHGVDGTYEVKPMNHDESLQLFCLKAFRRRGVPHDVQFRRLARSAVDYTIGLPLALCILGSFFYGRKTSTDWKYALEVLNQDSNNVNFKPLRLSYYELNYLEKIIFLDIACFFNKWGKDEIIQILDSCKLPARTALHTLKEKSFLAEIEIGNTIYIEMHDLVQDMGRLIVTQESPVEVRRRNRLWLPNDIDQLLERDMGTKATEGVVLPHSLEKDEVHWSPEAFLKLCCLRLLIISCDFDLPLHLEGLPGTLKVLHWHGYPMEALPPYEQLDQLVFLKMHNSKIMRLSYDRQSLKNLEILDLSYSKCLLQTPNLIGFPNLKRLILEGCTSLVEIHSSLGQLHFLVEVNLKGCLNLKVLPRKLEMNSLEKFILCGCIRVRNLPEFGEKMEKFITLDVKKTSIDKLPESLGSLTNIETLDLRCCQNLVGLPQNIHKLKCLKVLDVSGCSKFSELPENIYENEALEKLDASGTSIVEVPSSICYLKNLKTLAFHGCKKPTSNSRILCLLWNKMSQRHSFPKGLKLPAPIFNVESLTELDLSYCNINDGIIPNDLSGLSFMRKLDLSGNEFVNLPYGCISNLVNLKSFYLNSCSKLQFLPKPSPDLNLMDAGQCDSLRTLSDQTLLRFFASIGQDGQHAEGLRKIATLSVTIPGCEIPSWFEKQYYLPLINKHVASVTIDIPEDDEWLGIGLCTLIDHKTCLSCWGFDFEASDGKHVLLPRRTREHEKEIKSSHLWMVFWKIKEENRDEISRNYSQIRLKFCTDWELPPSAWVDDVESIKCGWRFISKGDLERLEDGSEISQTIIRECETMPSETSSLCSEDEFKLDDSWKQFIEDDARFWF